MSTAFSPTDQRLLLSDIDWSTYDCLLRDLEGRHLRFNFDRGQLEIMTVSAEHERIKKLLARLLEVLSEERRYVEFDQSPTFPHVPLAGIVEHLNQRGQTDETSIIRSFRAWVQTLAAGR